jgi:hypothetical protein
VARTLLSLLTIERLVPEPNHPIRIAVAQLKSDLAKRSGDAK